MGKQYTSRGLVHRGETVIELNSVWVKYSGSGRPAIMDVSLDIRKPCLVLVTGPNGAGKTTLLETCLGLLKPYRGIAKLLGVDTRDKRIVFARRKCSYVPQDFMKPPHTAYTVKQVIAMGFASSKSAFEPLTRSDEEKISRIAELFGINDLMNKPIGKLSGGQQQRVFLARALVRDPQLLFLDEPFSSIDPGSRSHIAEILGDYVRENRSVAMIVSHDIKPLKELADMVVELYNGTVREVVRYC